MMCKAKSLLVLILTLMVIRSFALAQPQPVLLKQVKDNGPAEKMSPTELTLLGDPLFNLVLKENPALTNLAKIEDLIQPDPNQRSTFVVDENIADPRRGQQRRSVLTFAGSNRGETLDGNVMLSVFFDSESFSDTPNVIEAWGWDNQRGRYNYYKLDNTGTPDLRLSWKFRVSSDGADLLSPSDRASSCVACHINGAPVMKELSRPWNNWHSLDSQITYLTTLASSNIRWSVANSIRLKNGRLKGAESLETGGILPSISQFNTRRINATLAHREADRSIVLDAEGFAQVLEGKRLLKSVFFTTEFNIISSRQKSGLHPVPKITTAGPKQDIKIPSSFFLNANLLAGGTPAGYRGLGIAKAQEFANFAVRPQEYKKLLIDSQVKLGGRQPGDADFAWFVPEPSHIDNDLTDRLLRLGIITPQFLAAVLAIDLENPVLSPEREQLHRFIPDKFRFKPLDSSSSEMNTHPDDLTTSVITNIESSNLPAESTPGKFLALLKSGDPLKLLRQQVDAYHERVRSRLDDPQSRAAELKKLHDLVIQRRRAVLDHEVLGTINETENRLFPIP